MVTILRKNLILLETMVESSGLTKTQTQDLSIVCRFKRHVLLNKPGRLQINDPNIPFTVNNMTEFAGLLFLATETKENIEVGVQFFKDSIDYTSPRGLVN